MQNKSLVIVESPTKAKTIGKILGDEFRVVSSMGHLVDLPTKELGVDIEKDFSPDYVVVPGRKKVLAALKKEAKDKENIYVATDPDREGEAIGWHIKNRILKDKKIMRVVFHELTPEAVKKAFAHTRDIDLKMVEAQIGRRILDRIVGYFLSPLLWRKIMRGLSAGRVQSVALRFIVEREKQIKNFIPQEYWEIAAQLRKVESLEFRVHSSFLAKLEKVGEKKAEVKNKEEVDKIVEDLKDKRFKVLEIKKSERRRFPEPPFITSTLQQEAFNKLHFSATKTMILAQQLYEGIDIGRDTPVGLITYMRTDSPRVAAEAIKEAREYIRKEFGERYLPQTPYIYKVRKFAQEAHEAIRPTLIAHPPEGLKEYLNQEQYKLYELIYRRFIASQMMSAKYLATTVDIHAEKYLFIASGSELIFEGFLAVYNQNNNEGEKKNPIPALEKDEILDLEKLTPSQHFTKPPAHFSDSSLVKALEEEGIGRPSTYAPIISTLILRDYVRRIKGYFYPTELGFKVCDLLLEYFPGIMDIKFTAQMEEELDGIEEGRLDRLGVLQDFYPSFKSSLDFAHQHIKREVVKTDQICEKCGRPMIIKWGRKGKFLSCSGYPGCKNSKSITSGVKCPQPGCGGELVERRWRRGFFYGCTNFPKCKFTQPLPAGAGFTPKTLPEDIK